LLFQLIIIHMKENKLRELRIKNGLTQKDLIKKLNLSNSQNRVSKWERGTAVPSLENLSKLCRIYNVEIKELYPGF